MRLSVTCVGIIASVPDTGDHCMLNNADIEGGEGRKHGQVTQTVSHVKMDGIPFRHVRCHLRQQVGRHPIVRIGDDT